MPISNFFSVKALSPLKLFCLYILFSPGEIVDDDDAFFLKKKIKRY